MTDLLSRRRVRTAFVGATLALAALALPGAASATLNCTFAANALTLTRSGTGSDDITLRVNGTAIQFLDDGVPVACGAPTINNTASIAYVHDAGIADLFIEDPDKLAPGFGGPAEGAGAPEIEISLTENGGILSDVQLIDTDGSGQSYVIGSLGANFNPGEAVPDVDLTLVGFFPAIVPVGGPGPDRFDLRGGAGTGTAYSESLALRGGAGADQLFAGSGTYELDGGPGDDLLDATANANARVDYSDSTLPVNLDLTAAGPQDGGSLGRDTLIGVTGLVGSPFGDVLRGTAAEDDLEGGPGDDLLEGRGGDDNLYGDGGLDLASYESAPAAVTVDLFKMERQDTVGAGKDYLSSGEIEGLIGSPSGDTLLGTDGVNLIDGRGGSDVVKALGGNDDVLARDGAGDDVDCGAGDDEGIFDQPGLDKAVACEEADFLDVEVLLTLRAAKRQALAKRGVVASLTCPAEACSVVLTGSAKIKGSKGRLKLKRSRARLQAGKAKRVRPAFGGRSAAKVAKALREGKKVTVKLTAVASDAAGNRKTVSRTIVLKPAEKPKSKSRKRA